MKSNDFELSKKIASIIPFHYVLTYTFQHTLSKKALT